MEQECLQADSIWPLHGPTRLFQERTQGIFTQVIQWKYDVLHLLTVFPNNAAEQEQYYIMNMLKKPQHVSVRQFVQRAEQLNSYIAQL